MTDFSK